MSDGGRLKFYQDNGDGLVEVPREKFMNSKKARSEDCEKPRPIFNTRDLKSEIEKELEEKNSEELYQLKKDSYSAALPITSYQDYFIFAVIIKKIMNACSTTYTLGASQHIQVDYDSYLEVPINGSFFFYFKKHIFHIMMEYQQRFIIINSSTGTVNELYEYMKNQYKENNFYRNKNMEFTGEEGIKFNRPNSAKFKDVIMNEALKQDIYLNTIYFMKKFDGNNGIIMHGPPGSGKSMACTAIVNEAIAEGFTTIYITEQVSINELRSFVEKVTGPAVIIWEDIDSIAQSRKDVLNTGLAKLLQFMSGISDLKSKVLFVATTNYLDHLDDAIKNRPMRFNRKYKVDYPDDKEVDALLTLYFGKIKTISNLCYGKNFTGAHIKELRRSFDLQKSINPKEKDEEVFKKCVEVVMNNFEVGGEHKLGFEQQQQPRKAGYLQ